MHSEVYKISHCKRCYQYKLHGIDVSNFVLVFCLLFFLLICRLKNIPRPKFTVCVLGDQQHCDEAKANDVAHMDAEALKKLNKNKKLVKKLGNYFESFSLKIKLNLNDLHCNFFPCNILLILPLKCAYRTLLWLYKMYL